MGQATCRTAPPSSVCQVTSRVLSCPQVRLYHALLAQTQARPREWAARLCGHLQARGLDVSSPLALTPAHRATLAAMGFPPTLRAAAVAYAQLVRSLPPLSSTLAGRVCYLSQADCRILHDMDVHISQVTHRGCAHWSH